MARRHRMLQPTPRSKRREFLTPQERFRGVQMRAMQNAMELREIDRSIANRINHFAEAEADIWARLGRYPFAPKTRGCGQ